jgi:DNA-binding transcriptional MerR regulator
MDELRRRTDGDRGGSRYTLAELTEAAGVSVRTVRYYISEGLLPPPFGAGPASHYSGAHLNRLALIGRLKDAYLPLKEIRRRLTGLGDAEVAALLAAEEAAEAPVAGSRASPDDDALTYIDRVLNPAGAGVTRRTAAPPRDTGGDAGGTGGGVASPGRERPDAAIREAPPLWDAEPDADEPDEAATMGASQTTRPLASLLPRLPATADEEPIDHGEPWLRIRLGEEAELLVSDGLLRRRRDKVDWLVRWARRVFR